MRPTLFILLIIISTLSYGQDHSRETTRARANTHHNLQKDSKDRGFVQVSPQNQLSEEPLKDKFKPVEKKRKKSRYKQIEPQRAAYLNYNDTSSVNENSSGKHFPILWIIGIVFMVLVFFLIAYGRSDGYRDEDTYSDSWKRMTMSRRDYYNEVYLKSEEWRRKRYVVLKRDNWKCVYCGEPATEVHHTRYAKYHIGKEPIEWLVSICRPCHDAEHNIKSEPPKKNRLDNWGWDKQLDN